MDLDQLQRQTLQCSWTSVRDYLATDLGSLPFYTTFQTIAEDVFIWSVGPKRSVNLSATAL